MPGTMFQETVCPRSESSRKWYTLPLSFAIHTAVIAVLIVVPLVATAVLPSPRVLLHPYVDVTLPPVIPLAPPLRQAPQRPDPTVNPIVAPVQPPSGIGIESALEFRESVTLGTPDGIVAGLGASPLAIDAPPPAPVPQVLRAGGVIKAPMRVKDAAPVYPEIAKANRVQGVVIVEATIGTDGKVKNATILRSVTLLDNAALDAVRAWEYTPTLLNGEPVTVVMTVTVNFKLN